jgi:hypothetical protein
MSLCRSGSRGAENHGVGRTVEPVQDDRIYFEKINCPFLFQHKGTRAECKPGWTMPLPGAGCGSRERHLNEVHREPHG